jgi:hypothetical protein
MRKMMLMAALALCGCEMDAIEACGRACQETNARMASYRDGAACRRRGGVSRV